MEIFNIGENAGYDEIVSMGPKWWTEYREMDAVYRYQGWLSDLEIHFINRLIKNQFPGQADEQTVAMFEAMFCLEPEPGDNLDERRRVVAAYYSGTGKLSGSIIQSIIRSYTGSESDVWWNGNQFNIRIYSNDDVSFSVGKIYQIIARRFPAHLIFWIRNMLCIFELNETVNVCRVIYRNDFIWWNKVLDGRNMLDGSVQIDASFPPFFLYKLPVLIRTELKIQNTAFVVRTHIWNDFSSEIKTVFRMLMDWWEELRNLDGAEILDGSSLLNQEFPPYWNRQIYRMDTQVSEEFSVSMYIPSNAKLDGAAMLDGTMKLNAGREVL